MVLDAEAERSVLGSLLRDPAAVADVRAILRPVDMGMPRHVAILRAIYAEHDATGATDPIAVGNRTPMPGVLHSPLPSRFRQVNVRS